MRRLLCLLWLLHVGCGSRSGLSSDDRTSPPPPDAPPGNPVSCAPDAVSCGGSARGTWRIATAERASIAYLFLFLNQTADPDREHFLLDVLDENGEDGCRRNGDYDPEGDANSSFAFSNENMGGHFKPPCGEPAGHEIRVELDPRAPCTGDIFDAKIRYSDPTAPYNLEGTAVHCGCEIDWEPFKDPLPPFPPAGCLGP